YCFSTANLIIYYKSEPVATSVYSKYQESMPLPEIAICSRNPLNVSHLLLQGYTAAEISDFVSLFTLDDYESMGFNYYNSETTPEQRILSGSWEKFLYENGPQCESVLMSCYIEGDTFPCCKRAIAVQHYNYGTCFVLKNVTQTMPGPTSLVITVATMKPNLD